MTWLFAWAFASLAAAPAATATSANVTTRVDARIDVERATVKGTVALSVVNVTADPLEVAYVWLEANRFARRPAALNEVNFYWVYPERFDPGSMRITAVRGGTAQVAPHATAGRDTLVEIHLKRPIPVGGRARLTIAFETRVPERLGAFGCIDGDCVMAGGWYPMLATLDDAGWDLQAPPAWGAIEARVLSAHDSSVSTFSEPDAPYLTLVAGATRHATLREHRGVSLSYLALSAPPPADDTQEQILPYTAEDRAARALDIAGEAIDFLAEVGAPMPAGTALTFAEAPLRLELAQAHPGVILVSDRVFRLFPFGRFRKFHERELVRAIYTEYFSLRGATLPPRERDATAEAAAAYLLDLFTLRAYRKAEFARDLLSPASWIPAVDELLYAPQVAFADAYFGTIADTDELRDDPRRFMHERPRGHLYYEKLRDLLDAKQLAAAMRGVIVDGRPLRAAAESASGDSLGWFFRQWSGPYPPVNVRLGRHTTEKQAGGEWRHTVEIVKTTPHGEPGPIEPIEVRAVDGQGKRYDLRWDGHGDRGGVAFLAPSSSLRSIELDPRRRLVETGASASSDDPRFDDRTPKRFKFLYNGFGALLNFSNLSFGLLWDFSIRRVHDTRNDLRLTIFSSEAVKLGGTVGYSRHFGRNVTALRRASSVGASLSVARLDQDFGGSPSDGTRVSLGVGWGTDDRLFEFEPMRARGASIGARYSITRFDAGGDARQTAALFADVTRIVTPVEGHTFVANLEGAVVGGDIAARAQLLAAGGPGLLRGYFPDELFGRARVTGHLEWRGSLRHDLDWNLGHFWFLRGIGAAAFADAGALSSCDAYDDLFAEKNLYADVGMGLRFFYDIFGVQPGMMALDFAVPLVLRPRACLSGEAELQTSRPPFMVYLTFLPPF